MSPAAEIIRALAGLLAAGLVACLGVIVVAIWRGVRRPPQERDDE